MRKFSLFHKRLLLAVALILSFSENFKAQTCTNSSQGGMGGCAISTTYYGEILPGSTCGTYTTISNYTPTQYFRIPVLNGACYTVSTCGSPIDSHISCYQIGSSTPFVYNDDNGPACMGLQSSVDMVPSFTDYAHVDVREYPCRASATASVTVYVRQNNNLNITSSSASMCTGGTRNLTATPVAVTSAQPNSGNLGTFTGSGVSGTTFSAPLPSGQSQAYTVTYTFGYCSTTQSITVFRPSSQADAGPDQIICNSATNLAAAAPAYGTGAWNIITGPGSVTAPNSPVSQVTGLVPGQSTVLRWTVTNGTCASTADTVVLTHDALPSAAVAGTGQTICGDTAYLAANTPAVGSGTWTVSSGSGTFAIPSDPSTMVTGISMGSNIYVWTISNGTCPARRDSVSVFRDSQASQPFAGPDKITCDSSTILAGNIPAAGSGLWAILSGSGILTNPSSPNAVLSNIAIGTTMLSWTISNGACPTRSDTMLVTRNASPASPTVSGNTNVCFGNQAILTASSAAPGPVYIWWDAPAGGNVVATGAIYASPPMTSQQVLYAEVTDGNTGCPSQRTQVTISVFALPVVNLGPDTTICSNDSICLSAGSGFANYLWSTGATVETICTNIAANYWVRVTDSTGCQGRDTLRVSVLPAPALNLGPDFVLCTGDSAILGVTGLPDLTYLWNTNDTTPMITVYAGGTYTLIAADTNGCSATDLIVVSEYNVPVAAFSVDTAACPIIQFTDLSVDATSWSWSFGNGSTSTNQNPAHNYHNSGNNSYTVTLIANGPCGSDTTTQVVDISCIVGLRLPGALNISVYPNPNDGRFMLRLEGMDAPLEFAVFNAAGQLVYKRYVNCPQTRCEELIQMPQTAAGVYYGRITIGDAVFTKKIMVR